MYIQICKVHVWESNIIWLSEQLQIILQDGKTKKNEIGHPAQTSYISTQFNFYSLSIF